MPYARPKGNTRFQEISQAKVGLPAIELDGEINAIKDYLNSLGSYTANVNEWAIEGGVPTYVSLTQFTLVGDLTAIYLPHRRLRCLLGSTPVYTAVDSSSYDGGQNKTTVTVKDEVLTAALSEIQYGLLGPTIDQLSIPITALTVPVVSKSVDYVATKHDTIILVDASAAARTITLPQVSIVSTSARARKFIVVKTDSSLNHVTVAPNAGDTINAASNYVLFEQGQRAELWGHGGTDWKQVARKAIPSGTIEMYAGAAAPAGWLLCNGAAISRTTYADLYALLGITFGAGDGSTTFNIPDMRGRAPIGVGTGTGLTARAMGAQVGEENHQLTIAEMPAHTHAIENLDILAGVGVSPDMGGSGSPDEFTKSTGGDTPHNTMQPSLAVNFIIKA